MAHDVFISYSSKDKTIADAVCATLESRKIRCWIAPRDVLPGLPYAEALIDGLNQSRVLILVLSASSIESQQVMREVERAVTKGIPVLPLRIEDVVPSKSLEYFVSSSHWLDALTPPLERHLQKLAASVQVLLANEKPSKLEPEFATPKPTLKVKFWKSGKRVYLITGVAVVVIILVFVVVFVVMGDRSNKALSSTLSNPIPNLSSTPNQSSTPKPTAISTPIPTLMRILFEDDFNNPNSGWPVRLDDVAEWGYENGEYSCLLKKTNWMVWAYNSNIDQFTDFVLEVDVTQISGPNASGSGLIFRSLDTNNFYCFAISSNGQYVIEKRTNGNWDTPLRNWTTSGLINQGNGTNRLKVVCIGSQIETYINGYQVDTVTDNSYIKGEVGMIVSTGEIYNHIHFDNVKVSSGISLK